MEHKDVVEAGIKPVKSNYKFDSLQATLISICTVGLFKIFEIKFFGAAYIAHCLTIPPSYCSDL